MVGHGISVLTGLVSIRLFTELAPQSVFGSANLILGMLTLGMHSLLAPITQTQIRYHSQYRETGNGKTYTRAILKFAICAAAIVMLVMAGLLSFWPALRLGSGLAIIGWLVAWVAISVWRGVSINRVQAERKQRRYSLWIGTEAILLMTATGAMLWVWPTVEGYIAGQLLGTALPALWFGRNSQGAIVQAKGSPSSVLGTLEVGRAAWLQVTKYGLPFVPFALLGWMSNLSDRYVLAANLDTNAVGQYVAAFSIASRLPSLVGGLMNDLFRPALFEAANRGDAVRGNRLFAAWMMGLGATVIALVFALYLSGELVARILLAESYRTNAATVMCWIATGYGCTVLAQVVENRLLSFGASQILIWTKLGGALANLTAAMILIPSFGVIGASQANAAGQAIMLFATLCAYFSIGRSKNGWSGQQVETTRA